MNIGTFIRKYTPCNARKLRQHETVWEAWDACNNPGHLMWAAVRLAPTPMLWRNLLADLLNEFAPRPVIEGLLRDPATRRHFLDAAAYATRAAAYAEDAANANAAHAAVCAFIKGRTTWIP